jgi:hypothetical protein
VRKPAALARFRIAVQALYRLRARPVPAVPSEFTLWNRGLPALQTCGLDVLVQNLLEQVMHRPFVLLATFFVESQPPACAIVIVIIDFQFGMGRDSISVDSNCNVTCRDATLLWSPQSQPAKSLPPLIDRKMTSLIRTIWFSSNTKRIRAVEVDGRPIAQASVDFGLYLRRRGHWSQSNSRSSRGFATATWTPRCFRQPFRS